MLTKPKRKVKMFIYLKYYLSSYGYSMAIPFEKLVDGMSDSIFKNAAGGLRIVPICVVV